MKVVKKSIFVEIKTLLTLAPMFINFLSRDWSNLMENFETNISSWGGSPVLGVTYSYTELPVVGQFCGIVKLCQQSMMLHLSKPGLSSFKMNCVFISINWWKSMHMITHIIANIHSCSCFLVSTCNKEASRVWELKLQCENYIILVLHKAPLYTASYLHLIDNNYIIILLHIQRALKTFYR